MKSNVLLIARPDRDENRAIEYAARQTGRGLRHAESSREAFEILSSGLDKIDIVIIDLDPGIHSISALEAIGCCDSAPPVIAVTGLEESEMAPIAYRHGAAACVSKPFEAVELVYIINRLCSSTERERRHSCDLWGHVSARS